MWNSITKLHILFNIVKGAFSIENDEQITIMHYIDFAF